MIFPDRLSCNCSRQALSDWIYSDRVRPQWGSQGTPGSPEAKHWVAHLASPLPDKDTFLSSEAVNSQMNQHFPYLGDHVTIDIIPTSIKNLSEQVCYGYNSWIPRNSQKTELCDVWDFFRHCYMWSKGGCVNGIIRWNSYASLNRAPRRMEYRKRRKFSNVCF